MKIILLLITVHLGFLNCFSQVRVGTVVTDSCYVFNHKFVLTETKNGIAKIKAFSGEKEATVLNTIKMSGPVYFVRENGKQNILQDDIFMKNGDIVKVFLIIGNEAPSCIKKDRNLKFEDEFCGMNVQGIVISPDGIRLTDFMYRGFTCIREHPLGLKDLFSFANSD